MSIINTTNRVLFFASLLTLPLADLAAANLSYSGQVSNCYAIIISGGDTTNHNVQQYWGDAAFFYSTLTKKYGYASNHIFALISDGTNTNVDRNDGTYTSPIYVNSPTDLDGDGMVDTDAAATFENVTNVFYQLASILTTNDQLLVFMTDHGRTNDCGDTYMYLWESWELYDYELKAMTTNLPCPVMFIIQQCYSGGFVNDLNQTNRLIATSCEASTTSDPGETSPHYDQYPYYWTAAIRGYIAGSHTNPWIDGAVCTGADVDGDGYVSFKEASDYAYAHRYTNQVPQYNESPTNLGSVMLMTKRIGAMGLSATEVGLSGSYGWTCLDETFTITSTNHIGLRFNNTVSYGSGDSGWLTVAPAAGVVVGNATREVLVSADMSLVNAGTHTATIAVSSANASNSPQSVTVNLTVQRANQSITFPAIAGQNRTNTAGLRATTSSGLPVNFSVGAGPAQIAGATNLSFTGTGPVSIVASQALNTNWTAWGEADAAFFGCSAGSAGDVNGDGFDDVIVGAYNAAGGGSQRGKAYVFLGSATGLQSTANWTATGEADYDKFGFSVGSAGDVNGDGYADVIIGASYYPSGNEKGKAYLFLGSASGLLTTTNWTAAGEAAGDYFGCSASAAGDVNGDGFDDVIVGAFNAAGSGTQRGKAYVFLGNATGLQSTANWTAAGAVDTNHFGRNVKSAGDVNGDGFDDVIISEDEPVNGLGSRRGKAYVFLGSAAGVQSAANWTATGEAYGDGFADHIGSAGDVNSDGFDDVIIGAGGAAGGGYMRGKAYVFLGSAAGLQTTANWTAVGEVNQDGFGSGIGAAGDVNGDGFDDVIVGAESSGKAYVFLGSTSGVQNALDWQATGEPDCVFFGDSVGSAGDVNGDGFDDVIVGDDYARSASGASRGKVYAFLGTANGVQNVNNWNTAPSVTNSFNVTATLPWPQNVDASDGRYADKVALSWSAVSNASGYQVWYHTADNSSAAVQIGTSTQTCYNDNAVLGGLTCYYWVKATNVYAVSAFSFSDSGWRRSAGSSRCAYMDLDGDGKMDLVLYDPLTGKWRAKLSGSGYAETSIILGGPNSTLVPGDYDGDGKVDPGIYEEPTGLWTVLLSSMNYATAIATLGSMGFAPVQADYDGDRKTEPGVYEAASGKWKVLLSASGYAEAGTTFGGSDYLPVQRDYDGDAKTDPAIYHLTLGDWGVMLSGSGYGIASALGFGGTGYSPVPGDYDGDRLADPAVYQESTGKWYVMLSGSGYGTASATLGGSGYAALPGDYDGDGKTDPAVYNTSTGDWYVMLSASGYGFATANFGGEGYDPAGFGVE